MRREERLMARKYVVVEIVGGSLLNVYGPYEGLREAKDRARRLIGKEDLLYDSDRDEEPEIDTPEIEIYVEETRKTRSSIRYLTLFGG